MNLSNVAQCERDGGLWIDGKHSIYRGYRKTRDYIAHIDFTLLKEKLMASPEDGGSGWTDELANKAEMKYKKWLFLKRKFENELIPPPHDIDAFWHGHILDSQAYMRNTTAIFGSAYVHHYPYFGMRGKADHAHF